MMGEIYSIYIYIYVYCSDKQTAINAVAQKISFCSSENNFFFNYDMLVIPFAHRY